MEWGSRSQIWRRWWWRWWWGCVRGKWGRWLCQMHTGGSRQARVGMGAQEAGLREDFFWNLRDLDTFVTLEGRRCGSCRATDKLLSWDPEHRKAIGFAKKGCSFSPERGSKKKGNVLYRHLQGGAGVTEFTPINLVWEVESKGRGGGASADRLRCGAALKAWEERPAWVQRSWTELKTVIVFFICQEKLAQRIWGS